MTSSDVADFLRRLSAEPARSFAEVFLVGDAGGARPVTREAFLDALPLRAEMFARAGVGEPLLDRVAVTELDQHYLVARTEWTAPRRGGDAVRLVSSYLLHRDGDDLRVVVYLNHRGVNGQDPNR
jgi:hypothetical protein